MEDKLAVPAPSTTPAVPESEAATIAATSITGDDKTSNAGEMPSDAELAAVATFQSPGVFVGVPAAPETLGRAIPLRVII